MSLANPAVITIDGVAHNLEQINQDNYGAVYLKKTATMELKMTVRHSYEGKTSAAQFERHNVDLIQTTWDTEGNPVVTQSYTVFRTPRNVDPARLSKQVVGFNNFVGTNAVALTTWQS